MQTDFKDTDDVMTLRYISLRKRCNSFSARAMITRFRQDGHKETPI